jgi:hypothetical protein
MSMARYLHGFADHHSETFFAVFSSVCKNHIYGLKRFFSLIASLFSKKKVNVSSKTDMSQPISLPKEPKNTTENDTTPPSGI